MRSVASRTSADVSACAEVTTFVLCACLLPRHCGGTGRLSPPPRRPPDAQSTVTPRTLQPGPGAHRPRRPRSVRAQPAAAWSHTQPRGDVLELSSRVWTAGATRAAPWTVGCASGHPDRGFKVRCTECSPEVSSRAGVLVEFGSNPGRATRTGFAGCSRGWRGVCTSRTGLWLLPPRGGQTAAPFGGRAALLSAPSPDPCHG